MQTNLNILSPNEFAGWIWNTLGNARDLHCIGALDKSLGFVC